MILLLNFARGNDFVDLRKKTYIQSYFPPLRPFFFRRMHILYNRENGRVICGKHKVRNEVGLIELWRTPSFTGVYLDTWVFKATLWYHLERRLFIIMIKFPYIPLVFHLHVIPLLFNLHVKPSCHALLKPLTYEKKHLFLSNRHLMIDICHYLLKKVFTTKIWLKLVKMSGYRTSRSLAVLRFSCFTTLKCYINTTA